jgi:uncharacterized FAD-dependent dehydrogenase
MGYRLISLKAQTDYSDAELRGLIAHELRIREFSFTIEGKSLDARRKSDIHWLLRIAVTSPELKGGTEILSPEIEIPEERRNKKVLIAGSGPAGFFAAFFLQKAGFSTILIERGKDVTARAKSIETFENHGAFDQQANYAFGEGGAGTFSDGKLTSRSKHISSERQFILNSYIQAGAPQEIAYMTHPHLGSDKLKNIVKNLRDEYESIGGSMQFETMLTDIEVSRGKVVSAISDKGVFQADYFIIALGHSAFETYRMLIKRGVAFRPKNFAIGSRMEHPQQIINMAQWGKESLPGVKAAEYRLTANPEGALPVYTFCMCPGGIVVPASAYENNNIVNGMSLYRRDLKFANAACVAGVNPYELIGEKADATVVLDWLEALETKFYNYSGGYKAPFCSINDFIKSREPRNIPETSYPLGLKASPLWELLPEKVSRSMRAGLIEFCRKIRGFETGIIMGLESKTSAPVQVLRDESRNCTGIENLYISGEGSGFAGGIISSAADGVKTAMSICGIDEK